MARKRRKIGLLIAIIYLIVLVIIVMPNASRIFREIITGEQSENTDSNSGNSIIAQVLRPPLGSDEDVGSIITSSYNDTGITGDNPEHFSYYNIDENTLEVPGMRQLYMAVINGEPKLVLNTTDEAYIEELFNNLCSMTGNTLYNWYLSHWRYTIYHNAGYTDIELYYREDCGQSINQAYSVACNLVTQMVEPDMSDMDIAKMFHDYLVLNTVYDSASLAAMDTEEPHFDTAHAASGCLIERLAVCDGYTQAYNLLLNLCDIETRQLTSNTYRHSWSMVYLDGGWYHVDVTFDDPTPDIANGIIYDYFLKNDEFIQADNDHEIIAGSPSATVNSYHYDIYSNRPFTIDGTTYSYVLEGTNLIRYSMVDNQIMADTGEVLVENVQSWVGVYIDESTLDRLMYCDINDGSIYTADFSGTNQEPIGQSQGVYLLEAMTADDGCNISYAGAMNGSVQEQVLED